MLLVALRVVVLVVCDRVEEFRRYYFTEMHFLQLHEPPGLRSGGFGLPAAVFSPCTTQQLHDSSMAAPQGVAWFYEMMSGFHHPCGEEVDRPPTLLLRPPRMTLTHKRKNQLAPWCLEGPPGALCGCPAAQQIPSVYCMHRRSRSHRLPCSVFCSASPNARVLPCSEQPPAEAAVVISDSSSSMMGVALLEMVSNTVSLASAEALLTVTPCRCMAMPSHHSMPATCCCRPDLRWRGVRTSNP